MRTALRFTSTLFLLAALAFAADLDGTWRFVLDTDDGAQEFNMSLKLEGSQVTGTTGDNVAVNGVYQNGLLQLKFPFHLEKPDTNGVLTITGRLQDGKLTGDWEIDDNSGTFEATNTK